MSRAEMTRSKAPRTVNTSVSRRPLSVLPKAAYRGSCWECDEPGATTNGRLKNTPSASPRVTSCKFQFLSAFPASHSNPTQRVSSSGKRCTTCILLPYTLPASCFPGAANYTKARAMLSSTHFHSSSRRYWRRAFAGFRLDAALLLSCRRFSGAALGALRRTLGHSRFATAQRFLPDLSATLRRGGPGIPWRSPPAHFPRFGRLPIEWHTGHCMVAHVWCVGSASNWALIRRGLNQGGTTGSPSCDRRGPPEGKAFEWVFLRRIAIPLWAATLVGVPRLARNADPVPRAPATSSRAWRRASYPSLLCRPFPLWLCSPTGCRRGRAAPWSHWRAPRPLAPRNGGK